MKNILALFISLLTFVSIGQEKVSKTGLNKGIPNNLEIGVKANMNFYFSQYKSIEDGAAEAIEDAKEPPGFGLGFFAHFKFSEHVGLQTELNAHYRKGHSSSYRRYDLDSSLILYKEDLSNFSTIWLEIPVYLKFHWEYTPINRGHWKSKSQFGVYVGPRLVLTPSSKRELARATTTRIYDNTTLSIENDITATTSYNTPVGVGVALGADYELWNGFTVHLAYYRGLTTHVRKENGFKAFDNRIEFGFGYRFN